MDLGSGKHGEDPRPTWHIVMCLAARGRLVFGSKSLDGDGVSLVLEAMEAFLLFFR